MPLCLCGDEAVREAIAQLTEPLTDFPFTSPADRAHLLAALLLPFCRRLIHGPTPAHLVTAPAPGSGKSLLSDVVSILATGREAPKNTLPREEERAKNLLFALLLTGSPIITIDNLPEGGEVDSPTLAAILATTEYQDRVLGESRTVHVQNRATWILTGNNPRFSTELIRRMIRIHIDPRVAQPWERSGFRIPHLLPWMKQHRARLVQAALTVIGAWIHAGRPAYTGKSLGSFEHYSETMGGILQHAGVEGFLATQSTMIDEANTDLADWTAFCNAWAAETNGAPMKPKELVEFCTSKELLLDVLGDKGLSSQLSRIGKALHRRQGRIYGNWRLLPPVIDPKTSSRIYALEDVTE